jgi:O-antigen ligase
MLVPSLFMMVLALFTTLSRGALIAGFLGTLLLLASYLRKMEVGRLKIMIGFAALFLAASLMVLSSTPMVKRLKSAAASSFNSRVVVWKECIPLIKESPFTGKGPGSFPWAFTSVRPPGLTARFREAHNDWLQIVTELGIPVLIPLVWGAFLIFKTALRRFQEMKDPFYLALTMGSASGIAAILIHSVFDFNIQITSNGILFSCLMGFIAGPESSSVNRALLRKRPELSVGGSPGDNQRWESGADRL